MVEFLAGFASCFALFLLMGVISLARKARQHNSIQDIHETSVIVKGKGEG